MSVPLPGVAVAPTAGQPTTLDLMRMYVVMTQRAAAIKAEAEQLAAMMKTIELTLGSKLDPNDDEAAFKHQFEDGVKVHVGKKKRERWVPIDGQSNEFWNWVFTSGHAMQFCTRELKQEGVDAWRETHRTPLMPDGELPPFVKRMSIVSPVVEVTGLKKPKTSVPTK